MVSTRLSAETTVAKGEPDGASSGWTFEDEYRAGKNLQFAQQLFQAPHAVTDMGGSALHG
ncbi:MAG: hypothetical protein WA966_12365 [Ornithinimicrobium sp.]